MKFVGKQNLHQHLGAYLREKRERAGYTQSDIAQKLGYSTPQFISNFERGLCAPPMKNLKTFVKLYKISVDEIVNLIIKEQESTLRRELSARRS
jgi:transcriptional regulator with XRE-family HTH domain